jgi:hypothetical protein
MRHTLLRHFQGVLLGAWIGQALTNDNPGNVSYWQILAKVLVDSLWHNTGDINWQEVWQNVDLSPVNINHLTKTSTEPINSIDTIDQSTIFTSQNTPHLSFSQVFAGLLPIILFHHENPQKLQKELTKADQAICESQWGKDLACPEEEIIRRQIMMNNLANLIAGLLQEKYNLEASLNYQAILFPLFDQLSATDPLYHQLLLLQDILIRGESLHRAIALLETNGKYLGKETGFDYQIYTPILLALYCFCDTPNNSKIAMERGIQCPTKQAVSPLLGILLGVHHSRSGIPIQWQINNTLLNPSNHINTEELSQHQITSPQIKQINLMAEKLWLAWSGFYLPHNNADGSLYNTNIAIASCNIMRPRPFPR